MNFDGVFDDFAIAFGAKAQKIDASYYMVIEKFPSILFLSMIAPIKGKWIRFSESDFATSTGFGGGMVESIGKSLFSAEKSYKESNLKDVELIRRSISLADESNLFTVKDVKKIKGNDGKYNYVYEMTAMRENVISFLEKLQTEIINIKGANDVSAYSVNNMLTYLRDLVTSRDFDYIISNTFTDITVNGDGIPIGGKIRFRAVPPADVEHLSNKQLDSLLSISIVEFNQPVNITPPATSITAKEADELLSKSLPAVF